MNVRNIYISHVSHSQSRVMNKILFGRSKKKHKYIDNPTLPTPNSFVKGAFEGKRSVNSKRVNVLNKLFMRHITDLMATGESSDLLVGHGIEISKVQVTPDFQQVNVYWLGKGTLDDATIKDILKAKAGCLRHELSQLRVMGQVPRINFVKDLQIARLAEIDARLATADFGDNHIPMQSANELQKKFNMCDPLIPNTFNSIEDLDIFPKMPQNVLGLDHQKLMDKVLKLIKKSKAMHRVKQEEAQESATNSSDLKQGEIAPECISTNQQRETFKKFLKKRRELQAKAFKDSKYDKPELDYLEDEAMRKQSVSVENMMKIRDLADEDDFFDPNDEVK